MERFEIVAQHNRWQDADKVANFPLYLEEAAAGWYRTEHPPNQWLDTAAANNVPAVIGLKNTFLNVFKPADYKRFQEQKLMKRAQGLEEPLLSYYFDILETCQNVDPAMQEERKVGHLLNGLKPTLAEKIIPYEVKTCKEFLERAKLLVRATEFANAPGRNQAIVAAAQAKIDCETKPLSDNAENNTNPTDDSIKQILKSLLEQQQASLLAHASARRPDPKPEPTPETNLIQQLKNLFVPQPAAPQTDQEIIIDGIRKMLQRQNNIRGNGRGRGRGGRGSYNSGQRTRATRIRMLCVTTARNLDTFNAFVLNGKKTISSFVQTKKMKNLLQ